MFLSRTPVLSVCPVMSTRSEGYSVSTAALLSSTVEELGRIVALF